MSTGRLSITNEMERSRRILAHAVEKSRDPAPGLAEDKLRCTLRDCMTLASEIETIDDLLNVFNVDRRRRFETAMKDYADRRQAWGVEKRSYEMLRDRWARMRGFTTRVADLAGLPTTGLGYQPVAHILFTEIVEACFDAALACEQNYESARLRPVETAGAVC